MQESSIHETIQADESELKDFPAGTLQNSAAISIE